MYRWDSEGWRTWSTGAPGRPRPAFLGILLVLVGVGLLIELVVPALSFFSLVILAVGIALAYAWLGRGILGATVPSLVLIGWGLARLGDELGVLPGDGWLALFVGIAFILAGVAGRMQLARRDWAFWVGGLLRDHRAGRCHGRGPGHVRPGCARAAGGHRLRRLSRVAQPVQLRLTTRELSASSGPRDPGPRA